MGWSGQRLFCSRLVRTVLLAAALSLLTPVRDGAQARTTRAPWLLFPLDVRSFDRVSSKFGIRKMQGRRALHRGVDLVAPRGSLVVAAREGRVTDTGRARACGWYVTVEHENSWRTVYCHEFSCSTVTSSRARPSRVLVLDRHVPSASARPR